MRTKAKEIQRLIDTGLLDLEELIKDYGSIENLLNLYPDLNLNNLITAEAIKEEQ